MRSPRTCAAWRRRSTILTEASESREQPVVILSDACEEPDRIRFAGAIEAHREAWLGERGRRLLLDNAHRAAERCRERGFTTSFHPHAGTYVESPREVDALLEQMDTALLGLCFDSGHCAFGGGDPLALLREAGELVNHVHVKDVDLDQLERLHTQGQGLEEAWAAGVFCELGCGGARVDECLGAAAGDRLRRSGSWSSRIVCPHRTSPSSGALEAAERNRDWLRERGL